jgi:hypothetical protein
MNNIVYSKGRLRSILNLDITIHSLAGKVEPSREKSSPSNRRTRAIGSGCVIMVEFGTRLWIYFQVISSAYTKLRPELQVHKSFDNLKWKYVEECVTICHSARQKPILRYSHHLKHLPTVHPSVLVFKQHPCPVTF